MAYIKREKYTVIDDNDLKKELLDNPIELCERFIKIAKIWDAVKDYPIVKLLLKFNENVKLYLISYLYRIPMQKSVDEKKDS